MVRHMQVFPVPRAYVKKKAKRRFFSCSALITLEAETSTLPQHGFVYSFVPSFVKYLLSISFMEAAKVFEKSE